MTVLPPATENVAVPATDGTPLAASVYEPSSPTEPATVVLVNSATGVRRGFYDGFARFLASSGLAVVTYDYRGIGDSRPATLRGYPARMRDWGALDLAGVIAWIDARFPDRRLVAVGHSAGGQLLGLAPNAGRVSAMLGVGAQSGWWGHWPRPRRYLNALLWYVVVPTLTPLVGYFPARRLRLGEDLPSGVVREWARWCRHRQYMVDDNGIALRPYFDRFRGPLLALSIGGDHYAPAESVAALARWYTRASVHLQHLDPATFGLPSLGHFGFFRERRGAPLWGRVAAWLHSPRAEDLTPTT
jgi:predicted alpha/beta hydrolase